MAYKALITILYILVKNMKIKKLSIIRFGKILRHWGFRQHVVKLGERMMAIRRIKAIIRIGIVERIKAMGRIVISKAVAGGHRKPVIIRAIGQWAIGRWSERRCSVSARAGSQRTAQLSLGGRTRPWSRFCIGVRIR